MKDLSGQCRIVKDIEIIKRNKEILKLLVKNQGIQEINVFGQNLACVNSNPPIPVFGCVGKKMPLIDYRHLV
ncbi:hypothetical protein I3760_03G174300 [Carya illinoinensis]|nr:hypothetical protein I3760_03G174300 [Carya illinoinensis]